MLPRPTLGRNPRISAGALRRSYPPPDQVFNDEQISYNIRMHLTLPYLKLPPSVGKGLAFCSKKGGTGLGVNRVGKTLSAQDQWKNRNITQRQSLKSGPFHFLGWLAWFPFHWLAWFPSFPLPDPDRGAGIRTALPPGVCHMAGRSGFPRSRE